MASLEAMRQYLAAHQPPPVQVHIPLDGLAEAFRSMFGSPDGRSLQVVNNISPRP